MCGLDFSEKGKLLKWIWQKNFLQGHWTILVDGHFWSGMSKFGVRKRMLYMIKDNFGDLITPWPLTETWLMVTTGYPKSHHSKKVQNCSSTVNLGCLTVELQVLPWKIPVIYCTWIRHYTSLGIYSVKILKRKNWWNSISGQDLIFDLELFKVTTDLLKGTWFSIGLIFIVLFTFYH